MRVGRLCFLVTKLWMWRLSFSMPDSKSNIELSSHLKYLIVGNLPLIKWVINLRRIFVLLPVYKIDLLALANSYAPSSSGKVLMTSRVNFLHLPLIGIINLLILEFDRLLGYNISTYKSPPMGTGGLEPPRQLPASSYQDYCGCQLHHVPISENSEGASLPAETPSKTPQLKRYHNLCSLSIGSSTIYYDKITMGVKNGYLSQVL